MSHVNGRFLDPKSSVWSIAWENLWRPLVDRRLLVVELTSHFFFWWLCWEFMLFFVERVEGGAVAVEVEVCNSERRYCNNFFWHEIRKEQMWLMWLHGWMCSGRWVGSSTAASHKGTQRKWVAGRGHVQTVKIVKVCFLQQSLSWNVLNFRRSNLRKGRELQGTITYPTWRKPENTENHGLKKVPAEGMGICFLFPAGGYMLHDFFGNLGVTP